MSTKTTFLNSSDEYFHVYNRGVNRDPIFLEGRNYTYFLKKLWRYLPSSGLELLAYCLMPNHFHFLVRQERPYALSVVVGNLCNGYAKGMNRALKRSGHLFESKYKLKLVDETRYLSYLTGYIHLNPVRAGLVRLPEEWDYSSCQDYLGMRPDSQVNSTIVLESFRDRKDYFEFMCGPASVPKELEVYLFDEPS